MVCKKGIFSKLSGKNLTGFQNLSGLDIKWYAKKVSSLNYREKT
jgi:hypothetical protein